MAHREAGSHRLRLHAGNQLQPVSMHVRLLQPLLCPLLVRLLVQHTPSCLRAAGRPFALSMSPYHACLALPRLETESLDTIRDFDIVWPSMSIP